MEWGLPVFGFWYSANLGVLSGYCPPPPPPPVPHGYAYAKAKELASNF